MLSKDKFTEKYNEASMALLGKEASSDVIDNDYNAYMNIVETLGDDDTIEFGESETEPGQVGYNISYQCAP